MGSWFTTVRRMATAATKTESSLYSRFRNALDPSWIASAISCILLLPAGCAMTPFARCSAYATAAPEHKNAKLICLAVLCCAVKCVAKTSFLFGFFLVFSWFFPVFFSRMSFFFVENHSFVGCACSLEWSRGSSELVKRLSWSNEDCDKDFFLQGARSPSGLSLGSGSRFFL